jgi:hypothetical protein
MILRSTEVAGNNSFEELVELGDIEAIEDGIKERLLKAVAAI